MPVIRWSPRRLPAPKSGIVPLYSPPGYAPRNPPYLYVSGTNMTANKARLLLMAAMLKLGALPPAADPTSPTHGELDAIKAKLDQYQAIFDTH